MIIEIRKEILMNMFKKLRCGNIFKFTDITYKDECLTSISKNDDVARYFKLPTHRFSVKDGKELAFWIDIEKVMGFVSLAKGKTYISVEFDIKNERLIITIEGKDNCKSVTKISIAFVDYKTSLPYVIKKGIPYVENGKVALDTHFLMKNSDVVDIAKNCSVLKSDKLSVNIKRKTRKFVGLIGDATEVKDFTKFEPQIKIYNINEDVNIEFNKFVSKVFRSFDNDVEFFVRSNFPMFMSEITDDYDYDVLLTPFIFKK